MFFGLGEFVQDTNFACLRACYGKGYVPDVSPQRRVGNVFLELQQVANKAAAKYGFRTIDEDELIGPSTATLINQIAAKAPVGALVHAPFDKEKVSREAMELIDALKKVLAGVPTTTTIPPLPTTTIPTFEPTPTPEPKVTETKTTTKVTQVVEPPKMKPKTKIIAGVLIGAVVLGGGIAAVSIARSKRPPKRRGGPTRTAARRR